MKSEGPGKAYLVSRAVEEPLEATFELEDSIRDISKQAVRPLALGILGLIIFIAFLVPSVYYSLLELFRGFVSGALFWESVAAVVIIVFILAITITALMYLYQIRRFNAYLLGRHSVVTDLANAHPSAEEEREKRPEMQGKHLTNPIFAMLDLVEESMHELPQPVKLLRYCTFFITLIALFTLFALIAGFTSSGDLIIRATYWELTSGAIVLVILLPTLKLLVDAERLFTNLRIRHDIIDSVRFQEPIRIPEGEDPQARLVAHLMENDPYIKSSALAHKKTFMEDVELNGASGKVHKFDAFYKGVNVLKVQSRTMGMPMGRFAVFIRIFREDITIEALTAFREAAADVYAREGAFPLRIIALQWSIKELADDVYEYVLDNPLVTRNVLTHLEVISEDQDVYSFIPMISYGEKAG